MSLQSKYLAGISLGVMGVGFAATIPFQESMIGTIVQGGFEAGLVGGLLIGLQSRHYSVIQWEFQFRIQPYFQKIVNGLRKASFPHWRMIG